MRVKRLIITTILVLLFFVLQNTLFKYIEIGNVRPDICLILVITIAYCNGPKYGTLFGFVMGILYDVFFSSILGFYSLFYVIIGYLCGLLNKLFFDYNFDLKLPLFLFSGTSFIYNLIIYVFFYLIKGDLNLKHYFWSNIIPEILYTLLIGTVIYRILFMIDQKLSLDERKADGYFVSRN